MSFTGSMSVVHTRPNNVINISPPGESISSETQSKFSWQQKANNQHNVLFSVFLVLYINSIDFSVHPCVCVCVVCMCLCSFCVPFLMMCILFIG